MAISFTGTYRHQCCRRRTDALEGGVAKEWVAHNGRVLTVWNRCRNIKGFMIQTGDPTGTGKGGQSIWGKPFADEVRSTLKVSYHTACTTGPS